MPSIPFTITLDDVTLSSMRSQGSGGQNVNKVSSAVHLRFNILASSLPDELKQRLLAFQDQRITAEGEIVIKSQEHRNREQNRAEAFERLCELLKQVAYTPKKRKSTKATKASKERRLATKSKRGQVKKLRQSRSSE